MTYAIYALTPASEFMVTAEGAEDLFQRLKEDFEEFGESLQDIERLFGIADNTQSDWIEEYIKMAIAQEKE